MRRQGIAGSSALVLAGDLGSKSGVLVVMVVAAHRLSVDDVAAVGTALAVSGIVAYVLDAGSQLLITRDGTAGSVKRSGLLIGLARARLPLLVAVMGACAAIGLATGRVTVWLAAALLGLSGALGMSLIAFFRSQQDMRPEVGQKLSSAAVGLAAAGVAAWLAPTAAALLVGLTAAAFLSLLVLVFRLRATLEPGAPAAPWPMLRRALPLGLLTLATVVYYRSGTVALSLVSTSRETAMFTIASSVGFGLLMLPNAIQTGLLPHIARAGAGRSTVSTRRALGWSVGLAVPLSAAAALVGVLLLGPVFGSTYAAARVPLVLMCAGAVVIAYNGVLGTALIAGGHIRAIAVQVGLTLLANLAALAVLAPAYGATGAAVATLVCELVGAIVLTVVSGRLLPGVVAFRRPLAPLGRSPQTSRV